jgi:ABC-type dipeptide/oligopeptide/nickel transport system permease component
MSPQALESVTWIKVEKPVFDLVGVVLSSLGLAFLCAVISFILGIVLGAYFVARRRRQALSWAEEISLGLAASEPPRG